MSASVAMQEKDRHQKALALIVCMFLGFMYVETVWKPYFFGVPASTSNAGQGSTQQSTAGTTFSSANSSGQRAATDTPSSIGNSPGGQTLDPVTPNSKFPRDAQVSDAGEVLVVTKNLQARVSLLGGRMTELLLRDYERDSLNGREKLNIVSHLENQPYPLGVSSGGVDDSWTTYRLVSPSTISRRNGRAELDISAANTSEKLVFQGTLPDKRQITKTFTFHSEGYLLDVDAQLSESAADSSKTSIEWNRFFTDEEGSMLQTYGAPGYTWFDDEKASREDFSGLEENNVALGNVRWLSLADKYFMAAMLSKGERLAGRYFHEDSVFHGQLFGDPRAISISLFAGPKSYRMLENYGYELQRNIDFGIFGVVSAPLLAMLHILYGFLGNYGLAIVALTILVRLALFPLNATAFRQMKSMQDLKPEMDRMKEQIKDKQKQQVALMELYKKKGVNPLGGCLPMVLQMPIFIGLYSALMLAVELRDAPFAGWITDLSAPEQLMILGTGVPVMVILFVVSMLVQQWTTPSTMDPVQKKVMLVMPLVMGFIFAGFPAGLTLYWLTNNVISIGQQKGMHRKDSTTKSALKVTLIVAVSSIAVAFIATLF